MYRSCCLQLQYHTTLCTRAKQLFSLSFCYFMNVCTVGCSLSNYCPMFQLVEFVDVLEYFMGQPELMTPAEFVRMYEKPPQVTLDGGQHIAMAKFIH